MVNFHLLISSSSVYENLLNVKNADLVNDILNNCGDEPNSQWRMLYVSWTVDYPTADSDSFEGIWIFN